MNRCVLVRVCVLISVLCLAAHVYVELKGYHMKSWRTLGPTVEAQKSAETVSEENRGWRKSVPSCYPTGRQDRKVSASLHSVES